MNLSASKTVPAFDFDLATRSLEELAAEFKQGAIRYPSLAHYLVEATDPRYPGFEDQLPLSKTLDEGSGLTMRVVQESGTPWRGHYYLDVDPDADGADLELMRALAGRAMKILSGWPAGSPGLPSEMDWPLEVRGRRVAEAWLTIVHRLAWENTPGSPLKAKHSTPAIDRHTLRGLDLSPADSAILRRDDHFFTTDIPADCFSSSLRGESLFRSSAWAIELILAKNANRPKQATSVSSEVSPNPPNPQGADAKETAGHDEQPPIEKGVMSKSSSKKKIIDYKALELIVGEHIKTQLKHRRKFTIRSIAKALGHAAATIQKTDAWRSYMIDKNLQKCLRGNTSIRTFNQTNLHINATAIETDYAANLDILEYNEIKYINEVSSEERAKYHAATQSKKREIIDNYISK